MKYLLCQIGLLVTIVTLTGCVGYSGSSTVEINSAKPEVIVDIPNTNNNPDDNVVQETQVTQNNIIQSEITNELAKEIAFTHARINSADASSVKCELDYDDAILKYKIEFVANDVEYEYSICASTSDILSFEVDNKSPNILTMIVTIEDTITQEEALNIALNHANIGNAHSIAIKCEIDFDNNIYDYIITFKIDQFNYQYEINAVTGEIVDYRVDG